MLLSGFKPRKICEKLLGQKLTAYILHLRPLEWPVVTMHFFLGTVLSCSDYNIKTITLGWVTFIVCLNGGTMAINSAFDNDEGDIGYLRNPPKPPKHLLHFSVFMLLVALILGFQISKLFAFCNTICILMSLVYSVPPIRLKARAGWDLIINCIGFGLLTPMAGWGLTSNYITVNGMKIMVGFAFLFGSLYPLTQIYQINEDKKRGDHTFLVILGEQVGLIFSIVSMIIAHIWFIWGLAQISNKHINIIFMLASFGTWLVVLIPWVIKWHSWNSKQHEARMYHALVAWTITDISFLTILGLH